MLLGPETLRLEAAIGEGLDFNQQNRIFNRDPPILGVFLHLGGGGGGGGWGAG